MLSRLVAFYALAVLALGACSGNDEKVLLELSEDGPGTCLKVPYDQGPQVDDLSEFVIDCSEQHSHEIYSVPLIPEDEFPVYPGFEGLETFAQAVCLRDFEPYVGISPFDSSLFYTWIVPTLTSWDKENDREVLCVVGVRNGATLTGTVRNSQL